MFYLASLLSALLPHRMLSMQQRGHLVIVCLARELWNSPYILSFLCSNSPKDSHLTQSKSQCLTVVYHSLQPAVHLCSWSSPLFLEQYMYVPSFMSLYWLFYLPGRWQSSLPNPYRPLFNVTLVVRPSLTPPHPSPPLTQFSVFWHSYFFFVSFAHYIFIFLFVVDVIIFITV